MTHEFILWICVAAYALHLIDEIVLDWKKWSETKMGHSKFEWSDFYVSSAVKLTVGFSCAMVGWQCPAFALLLPALLLLSAVFSHILPAIKHKKACPGLVSSLILFLPIGIWNFWGANADVVLTPAVLVLAFVFAIFVKWYARIIVKLHKKIA